MRKQRTSILGIMIFASFAGAIGACGGKATDQEGRNLSTQGTGGSEATESEAAEQTESQDSTQAPEGTEELLNQCNAFCAPESGCADHELCSLSCVENLWVADAHDCGTEWGETIDCLAASDCTETDACAEQGKPWRPCLARLEAAPFDSFPFEFEFNHCSLIWNRVKACDETLAWTSNGFHCDNSVTAATLQFDCMPLLRDWMHCMDRHDPCEAPDVCRPGRQAFDSCVSREEQ